MSVKGVQGNYQEFVQKLNSKGIKTTSLGGNETNFQQYGNALSDKLKQEILQSFDNDQDYKLQEQIAELFKGQGVSVMQSQGFINACKAAGLNVSVQYEATSYISDYKAGNTSGAVGNGSIAVYTISDGKGGEIKIADANGNGALESEELFMNEILGDINNSISTSASGSTPQAMQNDLGVEGVNAVEEEQITQEEYNKKVEEYLTLGFDENAAIDLANLMLDVEDMAYTGEFENKVSQEEFNEKVEKYLDLGFSNHQAREFAQNALKVKNMTYTGDGKKEEKEEKTA